MRAFLLSVSILTLLLGSCKNMTTTGPCSLPTGRFINMTVLDQCPDKMPSDVPHFCFEMTFRSKDSVMLDNGFEKFSLPFTETDEHCKFKISAATLFGDMYFILDSDSSIQLMDTAWTKLKTYSTFSKSSDPGKSEWSFEHHLNDCMLTGQYSLFKEGNLVPHVVDVLSNGQLNGMKPYLGYTICYAGDCLEETDPPARTIDLMDEKGNIETFVFKQVEGKMSIEFYKIGDPIPDIKGGRSIGPMIYEWRSE